MEKRGNQFRKKMAFEEALTKARHYAAYQERCIQDLFNKLRDWQVDPEEQNSIVDLLVEEGLVNEKRFAMAFVRGKFRMKAWGRLKIRAHLQQKGLDNRVIEEAILSIDSTDYQKQIARLLEKKIKRSTDVHTLRTRNQIMWYMVSKGYESNLVLKELKAHIPSD